MPSLRRLTCLVLLAASAAAGAPAAARADGDPASDVLLSQSVFYPYAPNKVPDDLQTALDAQLKAAKAKGYELKVALIAAQTDMGSVPQLFTAPQKYADLLTSEIAFNTKPRVLVVLPSGLGGNNLGGKAGDALGPVQVDPGAGAAGLARAALQAIGALTRANGTPVPVPALASQTGKPGDGGGDGGGPSPLLVFGLPVLLVALVAGGAILRDRRREEDEEQEDDGGSPADENGGEEAAAEDAATESAGQDPAREHGGPPADPQ